MHYSFYLFNKLFDLHYESDKPYDLLFLDAVKAYEEWVQWDFQEALQDEGQYESILRYLDTHPIEIN